MTSATDNRTTKRRNDVYRPCLTCAYSTVYDWDTMMVRCERSGETGIAAISDCLSYEKRKHIIDFAKHARRKVSR